MGIEDAGGATALFLEFSRQKLLDECWPRLQEAVAPLSMDETWWRPNDKSNSIGNLLRHLDGNVRQWAIAPFTGAADSRHRPAEFADRGSASAADLLDSLGRTLEEVSAVLTRLTEDDLLRAVIIQGYPVTGLEAVYHVVEHFSLHYGQMLYIVKQLRGEDLGFYRALDATGRLP